MRRSSEIAWLMEWLRKTRKKCPARGWNYGICKRGWDHDDFLRGLRKEAVQDGSEIWRILCEREISGKWPKMTSRIAHFLAARIDEALVLCEAWLKTNNVTEVPKPEQPLDSEALVKAAVITHWDDKGVDVWIANHKDDFFEDQSWDELLSQDPSYGIHPDYR